ncbi:hypothetical protein JW835_04200 [bacterium]|nr:hypothetical protein [bacterium]
MKRYIFTCLLIFISIFWKSSLRCEDIKNNKNNIEKWIKQKCPVFNNLSDVFFLDSNVGWIVGDNYTILKTINSGNEWLLQSIQEPISLWSIFIINSKIGWIVGDNGTILKTDNGGDSWMNQISNITNCLRSVYFINENIGWVVGDGGTILKTTDAGENWILLQSNSKVYLSSVFFINNEVGWIVGKNYLGLQGSGNGANILKINCENDWDLQLGQNKYLLQNILMQLKNFWKPTFSRGLNAVFFINENIGWTVGNNSTVFKTMSGGAEWEWNQIVYDKDLYLEYNDEVIFPIEYNDITFTSSKNGWIVGSEGSILKTQDGGINWHSIDINTKLNLKSIFFINDEIGWVVGNNGLIFKRDID